MVGFLRAVSDSVKAIQCQILSGAEYVYGSLGRIFTGQGEVAINRARALRRFAGCDPENDPVAPLPPFTGGQCPVRYRGQVSWTIATDFVQTFDVVAWGPISGASARPSPTNPGNIDLVIGSSGAAQGFCNNSFPPNDGPGQYPITSASTGANPRNVTTGGFTRCDGQADNCGDPPPVLPPPAPITINIDVTYNTEEGPEITVNIPFIFAPIVTDITGNFKIPFTFDFGGFEFSGDFEIAPKFEVTFNPPDAPRGTDSPITDLPAPDDEIPVELSTYKERVIGVVVQARLVGEQQLTTIGQTNIPQILAPRGGSIKFGYAIANRSFWSDDIDIKDLNTFIPCPFSQGADTVSASPAPGVVLNFVPVFGAPLATVADLGSTPEP